MNYLRVKKPKLIILASTLQLVLIISYLMLNISNVGGLGVALIYLAVFFTIALTILIIDGVNRKISISYISIALCFFLTWLALRIVLDLNDINELKSVTIGTTSGILLFYLVGLFSAKSINKLTLELKSTFSMKVLILIFLAFSILLAFSFQSRLLTRSDIFYLENIDAGYQRAGNFLIISFLITSLIFIATTLNLNKNKKIIFLLWTLLYSAGFFIALIVSQMFGSNAATANLLAIYLITTVISFFAYNRRVYNAYLQGNLSLPISKRAIKNILKYSFISLVTFISFIIIAINLTGFDINRLRVFGFGSGSNTSLTSRFDILIDYGLKQLSYAPILGNTNVAYLTTGNSGRTLHTFIPNIIAELGLVGLTLITFIFYFCFKKIYQNLKLKTANNSGFNQALFATWYFFIFVFLILYANIAVGKTWSVIWFFIGMISAKLPAKHNIY